MLGALRAGDRIATLEGGWAEVEEVYDTGEYEVVYNLRVADFHTYFVGGDGQALWAHNLSCADLAPIVSVTGHRAAIVQTVQKVIDSNPAIQPRLIWGSVESLMDTLVKPQADGLPGLADYQDGKVLKSFLEKLPAQFRSSPASGGYYVLYRASILAAAGDRVSIEQSFIPAAGQADLIDHTRRLALEVKYQTTDQASRVATELEKALRQIRGATGHLPPSGYARRVEVRLASPSNEMLTQTRDQIIAALAAKGITQASFGSASGPFADVQIQRPDGSELALIQRGDFP